MRSALARRPSYAPATSFFHHSFPPCAALLAALLLALGAPPSAHARPGVWSDTLAVHDRIAVHMVLMPADTADYTSQILWWEGSDATGFKGGVFLFRPASDQSDSVLQKDFDLRQVESPGLNIFCAGHTHMADGSAFINGGSELEGGENGENHSYIYDPVARGFSATQVDTMSQRRWYPTATLLPDGRLVSFSGSSYVSTHVWGGLGDGETVASDDSLHRMAIVAGGGWDPSIARGGLSESQWPLAREGHSVAYLGRHNAEFYFGGVASTGMTNTVWELFRDEPVLFSDYDYDWQKTNVSTSLRIPDARTQHIGVPYDDNVLLVFGGLEDGGTTNELWELRREPDNFGNLLWQWKQPLLNIGPRPSARMGAVAFDDPVLHRVLIFGGAADIDHPDPIAFRLPNESLTGHDLDEFLVSVDEIEDETDIDFLTALPDDVEKQVEAVRASSMW